MAIAIAETTHKPPSFPLRLSIIMSLPAKKAFSQEAFFHLGLPGPLQLVFIRTGQRLFRLDLIGLPLALPFYVSVACRNNGPGQQQVDMRRWALTSAAPDLRATKAAAMYMKLRSFQGSDLIIDALEGHHDQLTTLVVDAASFKSTLTILCPDAHVAAEPRAVVLWAMVMQQAMRGVGYMANGGSGDSGSLLRITMDPSTPGLGFVQARANLVEVPAPPRFLSDPTEAPATTIADETAQQPLEMQPEVSHIKLSAARSQRGDAQAQSNSSQQIRQEVDACIQPLLLQQESRLTAKIDALGHKLDAFLKLLSSSQASRGSLSVATQTSQVDAVSAGGSPAALALLSVKQIMIARDEAAPAEACFIPAGYGMEAGPVDEEEAAPADYSKNAVIESLPVQLASSTTSPLSQLELSLPPPRMSALISGLPLPQPPLFMVCEASPERSGASLAPLTAIPAQQICFPEQLQPFTGQRGRSQPSGSPPAAVKGHLTPHMGISAQLTDMLESLDTLGGPEQGSFPGLSFDAYDLLSSSDMDSEDEDLMAERKTFRAMLRPKRADSSHVPARSGICDRSTPNVRASSRAGKALRLDSISTTHGAGAVPSAPGRLKGSRPVGVPQPSMNAFVAFAARAAASGHRAGAAATDPVSTEAGASSPRAEAKGGALGCEANTPATALKTRADASALAEPEGPALVAVPSQQQEQCHPQPEQTEPANSELSGGDSLDSLLGDLPPFPTDDPLSFWQPSGSSIWEEAHRLAAQTYEVDNALDHSAAMGADDAAAGAGVPAEAPSVAADAGATAVVGAGAAVGCSDAAITTAALAFSSRDATKQQEASSQAGRSLSASRPALSVHGSLTNTDLSSSGTELLTYFPEAPSSSSQHQRPHAAVSGTGCSAQSGKEAQSLAPVNTANEQSDQALLTALCQSWQTKASDVVQRGHDSDHVSTLHQTECQNRAEEEQGAGGAAKEEDNAEEEVRKEGEAREEGGGGWVTGLPDGVVVDASPNYTAWLAGSMLNRLEADANNRGGQMGTLDLEEQRDLLAVGGSDAQAMYNVAVMNAVNEEVVAAQQRPAPILQQPRPLRRPPTTPNEVAHSVHGKVVQKTQLAAAPMHDMHKIQAMLQHDITEASASIDRGTASVEAQLKMQLADSIFDDLIGDTASMLLEML
ncbi:hypothetical protein WJX77_010248 [Trebouxia sp. C0004]